MMPRPISLLASENYYLHAPARPLRFGNDCRLDMSQNESALQDNLIFVNTVRQGEVLLYNEFGTRIHSHVFEMNDVATWMAIDTSIRAATNDWEPRVQIKKVEATSNSANGHKVDVYIEWKPKQAGSPAISTKIGNPYGPTLINDPV